VTTNTYHGSCHCGDVRYSATFDVSKGTVKCNCTLCTKVRSWHVILRADKFALLSDPALTTEYAWVAPGQAEPRIRYYSCARCHVGLFARGDMGTGPFCGIAINTLDDVDPDELAAAPVRYQDGLHDRWDRVPEDTRLL
jgi:hypothetical protein